MKTSLLILQIFCMTLFMTTFVHALGVYPAIRNIDFAPLEQYSSTFTVVNDRGTPLDVSFFAQGELTSLLTLPSRVTLPPGSTDIQYTLHLPAALSPGFHDVGILITEELPVPTGETVVGATVAVITSIKVFVPYPEKYVKADVVITEHPSGVEIKVPVENLGMMDIERIFATVRITDSSSTLATLTTETIPLPSRQRRDLKMEWTLPHQQGTYQADITLHYDGKETRMKKEFSYLSTGLLAITDINTKDLALGKINEIEITLHNRGNEIIEDIKTTVTIVDQQGVLVTTLSSPPITLDPSDDKQITLSWDAEQLPEGAYTIIVKAEHADGTIGRQFTTSISPKAASSPSLLTGKLTAAQKTFENKELSFWIAGIIIVIFGGLFYLLRKRKKEAVL